MITLEQSATVNRFEHATLKNKDGSPLRARRNGKTKYWKRLPNEFKIPIKIGLYEYTYIDKANYQDWNEAYTVTEPRTDGLRYVSPEVGEVDQDEEYY